MNTILDTSVIMSYPKAMTEFKNVIIPYCVLMELDGLQKNKGTAYKARKAKRMIMNKNIKCENLTKKELALVPDKVDDILIKIARKDNYKLYTMDLLMYKKGEAENSDVELYEINKDVYTGVKKIILSDKIINKLYEKGIAEYHYNLYENQFVDAGKIVARYKNGYLHKIDWNMVVNGLEGNPTRRQLMALDVLFDKDIKLVSIFGSQGTGKTTISLNSALKQVSSSKFNYNKILISRAKKQRNIDEGFASLPGELEEKYSPFNAPFYDNLYTQTPIHMETVPLSSIQGRSFDNAIWIITEAQDIAPEHTELIVGRCGKNTKLILEGDLNQNSSEQLNQSNNGLTKIINRLKESNITASIKLDESKDDIKRSELAKLSLILRG